MTACISTLTHYCLGYIYTTLLLRYQDLMQHRIAFVNVWLPISAEPIVQEPLAVCDWQSRLSDLSDWSGAEVEQRSSRK